MCRVVINACHGGFSQLGVIPRFEGEGREKPPIYTKVRYIWIIVLADGRTIQRGELYNGIVLTW